MGKKLRVKGAESWGLGGRRDNSKHISKGMVTNETVNPCRLEGVGQTRGARKASGKRSEDRELLINAANFH